ncbi:MAG: hypothetical protein CMP11_02075 [Zetaproteobacteria bacterium]|nr:hypothetical protein [Pseudobdellovibrionaceae bacterium]
MSLDTLLQTIALLTYNYKKISFPLNLQLISYMIDPALLIFFEKKGSGELKLMNITFLLISNFVK